ncbi:RagB/SusD family nutrient uptake outer membrane protein [Sphingobacterium chuzhouense]|uniref:RagB/SusD family nutrient uptake outer membrane protein n=1 Tax=Sphingobacterium chuzhouense TaxID=1742264 RepID=A0ABR7XME1_9SPHI|nr:RagB/SusD family nutrient uptake outer membrane protein [Sphingobacterium chuzhouense]MBD1420342.1 RagB/SusD family nutrient uptake outer membrane protein [Sphingobacterium chuzhouense]
MKNILVILMLLGLVSCSDFLEKKPDDMKTDDMIWKSRRETEAYLYNVYSQIPTSNLYQDDPWLGLSDEIDLTWNVYNTYQINLGNWTTTSGFYEKWPNWYRAIRASFVFENNVDRNHELSEQLKTQYKAEVKFLRGYYYWLLLRQYGPVVLIKELPPLDTDWNQFPRSPYDECVNYIVQMMDEAERDLPLHWQNDKQWLGKPTKIVCKAVKAEVLTMAASPQWNGNSDYINFKNHDGTALASIVYDENKWKRAADASYDVIKTAEDNANANVRLYKNHENGDGSTFSPYKSLRDVHIRRWNCEIIWAKAAFNHNGWEVHTSPGPNNLGGVGPTQRAVDAFFMKNGKTIDDPSSGYVEDGFATQGGEFWNPRNFDVTNDRVNMIEMIRNGDAWGHWPGEWNMYANREPRFYVSVLYNKRIIPQLPSDIVKRDYYSTNNSTVRQANGYGRVELYYGGMSRQSGSYTFYPQTGYLVLKNADPQSNMRDRVFVNTPRHDTFIRYAKVLLDYIESLNEYDPSHADIQKYWDMIRERAGIPSIYHVYPGIKGDKEQQREYILQERQVELAFEGDRYFTTRRRLLSATPDNGDPKRKYGDGGKMWGMDIHAGNAATNSFEFTGFYKRVPFETRVFDKKMNLFPIHQTEIDRNPAIVQNPGW